MLHKIIAIIGMAVYLMCFYGSLLGFYYLLFGTSVSRSISIIALIYQYTFCKKSTTLIKFFNKFKIYNYFTSFQTIYEEPLENQKKIIIPVMPHGIFGLSRNLTTMKDYNLFQDYHVLASRVLLMSPFSGILAILVGLEGVNNKNFLSLLQQGENIYFVPGGFEEATLIEYGKERIFYKQRKGWIKYALQYGYKVIPNYGFNEHKTYDTFSNKKLGLLLNKLKVPGVFPYSKYILPFPYFNLDLAQVFGKSIQFPKIDKPTAEDIEKYQQILLDETIKLYNKYKNQFNVSAQLEVF